MRNNEIKLSVTEKQELIAMHSTIKDGKIRDRIKAIILLSDGYSKAEIEKTLLITRRTILKLQNKYIKKGIKALLTDNNIGYEGKLTVKEKEELKNDLREKIFSSAKEVCDHVKNKFNKEYKPKSRERININGLFSPLDLEIITRQDDRIDSESTLQLLKEAEEKHPELDLIFVIRDNARYYVSKYLREKLKGSKIIMIPLPTYSPNLNLIERLWKFFKKKILYNKYYEKTDDFRNAVYNFFNNGVKTMQEELKTLMVENFHLFGEKDILNPN